MGGRALLRTSRPTRRSKSSSFLRPSERNVQTSHLRARACGEDHVPQHGRGLAHELPTEAQGHRVVKATRKRRRAPPRTPPGPAELWKLPGGSDLEAGTEQEPRWRALQAGGGAARVFHKLEAQGHGHRDTGRRHRARTVTCICRRANTWYLLCAPTRPPVLGLHKVALTLILGGAGSQDPKWLSDKSGAGSRYVPMSLPEARTSSSPGLTMTGPGWPPLLPTSNHSAHVVGLSAAHAQGGGSGAPVPRVDSGRRSRPPLPPPPSEMQTRPQTCATLPVARECGPGRGEAPSLPGLGHAVCPSDR